MTDEPEPQEVPDVRRQIVRRPAGHNFHVGRTRVDEGWRLIATCNCRHTITATNYGDLSGLINDHYADIRQQRDDARQEAAHT